MLRRRHPLPAARAYRRVIGSRTMRSGVDELGQRVLVVAFDGWNDAGEAASAAIPMCLANACSLETSR